MTSKQKQGTIWKEEGDGNKGLIARGRRSKRSKSWCEHPLRRLRLILGARQQPQAGDCIPIWTHVTRMRSKVDPLHRALRVDGKPAAILPTVRARDGLGIDDPFGSA